MIMAIRNFLIVYVSSGRVLRLDDLLRLLLVELLLVDLGRPDPGVWQDLVHQQRIGIVVDLDELDSGAHEGTLRNSPRVHQDVASLSSGHSLRRR